MVPQKFRLFVFIFSLVCIVSCEYGPDKENIKNIQQPSENHLFDLNLVSEFDTIAVFTPTEISYNFNTYGLDIKKGKFTLNGKSWEVYSKTGNFTIQPSDYPHGIYTLSLILYTNSGTGSISDIVGFEGYAVEKKWNFYIDENPNITPIQSLTKEGNLKITWPILKITDFMGYELGGYINNLSVSKTISNRNNNNYIDSSYIGGSSLFTITYKTNSNNYQTLSANLQLNDSFPTLKFTDLGVDSLRVFWNKSKYKAKYWLLREDVNPIDTMLFTMHDTSIVVPQPGFGSGVQFNLFTSPAYYSSLNIFFSKSDYKNHILGQHIANNWPDFSYNQQDNALYTNSYDEIECFDIPSLGKINSYRIDNLIYTRICKYSCPTNSTKIATISPNSIYVFADKKLENPILIPYNIGYQTIDHFFLTDNDLIAIAYQNKYELISITDKKVINSISIDNYPEYSSWACISTSKDGKYACIGNENGIKVFYIENGASDLIYADTRTYRSVSFNINNPNQLFLTFRNNNILEIRNVSDFGLEKSINLPTNNEVLRNVDPASGYLLLTDYKNSYVLNLNTSKIIFKIKCSISEYKPQLYGNKLLSVCGYALDISNYLKK
jgi:hypothetical protein